MEQSLLLHLSEAQTNYITVHINNLIKQKINKQELTREEMYYEEMYKHRFIDLFAMKLHQDKECHKAVIDFYEKKINPDSVKIPIQNMTKKGQ